MVDRGVLNILLRIQTIGFFKILLVVKHNLLLSEIMGGGRRTGL